MREVNERRQRRQPAVVHALLGIASLLAHRRLTSGSRPHNLELPFCPKRNFCPKPPKVAAQMLGRWAHLRPVCTQPPEDSIGEGRRGHTQHTSCSSRHARCADDRHLATLRRRRPGPLRLPARAPPGSRPPARCVSAKCTLEWAPPLLFLVIPGALVTPLSARRPLGAQSKGPSRRWHTWQLRPEPWQRARRRRQWPRRIHRASCASCGTVA